MSQKRLIKQFAKYDDSTPEFSLTGLKGYARVCKVYDGDSPSIILPFGKLYYKFTTRLSGIDTCEMKSSNTKAKELGHNARDRLVELITGEPVPSIAISQDPVEAEKEKKKWIQDKLNSEVYLVWVECQEFEKFGRVLLSMKKDEKDSQTFSELLVKEKLAYTYSGGTKLTEEQQVALLTNTK